jgi:hypothetical protein
MLSAAKSYVLPDWARSQKPDARALHYTIHNKIPEWNYGKILKRIGTPSANGAVFSTSRANVVVKVTPYSGNSNAEKRFQTLLGSQGIAPRSRNYEVININRELASKIFKNRNNVNKIAIHVMNHLKQSPTNNFMSVNNYVNSQPGRKINMPTYKMIYNKVMAMHRLGVSHSNLHWENAYVIVNKGTGQVKNVKIIDFGRSKHMGARTRASAAENYARRGTPGIFNENTFAYFSAGDTGRRSNINMLKTLNINFYRELSGR